MNTDETTIQRPSIAQYQEPLEFFQAMLTYRKQTERNFSVASATKSLRKVSPTLISLILKGQRKITVERIEEFSKLLKLTATEKNYFKNWLLRDSHPVIETAETRPSNRKEVSTHILTDWINVYVKDCFEIPEVQNNPELVFKLLANLGSKNRIEKSISFLMSEGHLRRTPSGAVVTETPLTVTDPQVPSRKIRQFHKAALSIAKETLETHPATERYANTLLLSMDEEKYFQMTQLIQEFAEKLKDFAAESKGPRLYQMIVNLSPTGGKSE